MPTRCSVSLVVRIFRDDDVPSRELARVTVGPALGSRPVRPSPWFLVANLLLSLAPFVFGVVWGISETHTLTPLEIAPSDGFRYAALVPRSAYDRFFDVEGDSPRHPRRAATRLYEDGRRLGPPHRPHDFIRDDGGGQFSHWGATLYFSTRDNTDPRANGRTYTLVTAARLRVEILWNWVICFLASVSLAFWQRPTPRAFAWPGRRGRILGATLLVVMYLAVARYSLDPASGGWLRGGRALTALWAASLLAGAMLAWQTGQALAGVGLGSVAGARARWNELYAWAGRPFDRPGWRGWIARAATLVIPFAAFTVVLRTALPPEVLFASYFSLTPVALPAGVALWCCYLRRDWIGTIAALTLTLALFALPLAALWQHFGIHYNAIGGLLPFSDASGYYYDARRLLDGHPLGWSARRPLFVGLLSTLLALTGGNLQLSLAAFVAVNAVACFLLAGELRASHGPAAAAVATIVLFLFYRIEGGAGTALTENLGFAMGTVAFAVLWRGFRETDARRVCIGVGLLTVALMARAGAFFVLPALVLAGAWAFRGDRRWLRVGLGASAAVVVAAGLTVGVGRVLADPAGAQTAFSNFSYSLYGLVVGGKGWGQVVRDHPGAREGPEIYALAFQAFRAHPMGLVAGSVKMWGMYFQPSEPYHAFAFVHDATYSRQFQIFCYLSSALGLGLALRRHRQPWSALLLAATLGLLGSIPFVPPIDAGLRAYAATAPILAILVGVGAAAALQWVRHLGGAAGVPGPASTDVAASEGPAWSGEIVGLALAAVVFAGPLWVFYTSRPPRVEDAACPNGTVSAHVRVSEGSILRIVGDVPDVDDTRIVVPEIRERDVRQTAGMVELRNDVNRFTAGHTMANVYDLKTGRFVWLVAPTALLPPSPGILRICGRESTDPLSRQYAVFYADSVQALTGSGQRP
jgi:hypothetical protein